MEGRYGFDLLLIWIVAFAFLFLTKWTWPLSILLIGWGVFRALSRNIPARQRELWVWNGFIGRITAALRPLFSRFSRWLAKKRLQWGQRKTHVFVRCPKCKSTLRLPRGRTLMVTCPVCGNEFKKKT